MMPPSRRRWTPPVWGAWKSRIYERKSTAAEIEADVAVLRAFAMRGQVRRILFGIVAAIAIVGGLLGAMGTQDPVPMIVGVPLGVLLLVVRKFVRVWEVRRIDLASVLLRGLAIPSGHEVQMHLDLRRTGIPANRSGNSPTGAERYEQRWLTIDAPLADGSHVRIARREHLDYLEQVFGRRRRRSWSFRFDDEVEVHLPDAAYRAPGATLGPESESRLQYPKEFLRQRFEAAPGRIFLAMRCDLRWSAPTAYGLPSGVLDGNQVMRGWISMLYGLAGSPAPLVEPPPASSASFSPFGVRDGALLLFLASLVPIPIAIEAYFITMERLSHGTPLTSIGQAGGVVICGAAALVGLVLSIWLFLLPRRRARRAARDAVTSGGA